MIKKTIIGLISLLLAVSACATEVQPQHVYVKITAEDSLIKSGLLKRLREFKDVEIMPNIEDAETGFYILAGKATAGGRVIGYAISVVYTDAFPFYSNIVPQEATVGSGSTLETLREFLTNERKGKAVLRDSRLYTCGRETLDNTLNQIVADMDVEVFEPIREFGAKAAEIAKHIGR